MSQRRAFVRLKGNRPVLVYMGMDGRQVQSYAVDVAEGGLLLAGPHVLQVGEDIEFQLTLAPGSQPVTGVGRVVRSDEMGRRAISFSELSELDRRRVVRFIFASERAERRRVSEAGERDGR